MKPTADRPYTDPEESFCVNHPTRLAANRCIVCGNPICHDCASRFEGLYCCPACQMAARNMPAIAPKTPKGRFISLRDLMVKFFFKLLPVLAGLGFILFVVFKNMFPDGGNLWERTFPQGMQPSGPALSDENLIFATSALHLLSLDRQNGKTLWTHETTSAAPIMNLRELSNHRLLYESAENLVCADASGTSLKILWQAAPRLQETKLLAGDEDNLLFSGTRKPETAAAGNAPLHYLECLDAARGDRIWTSPGFETEPQYTVSPDAVYALTTALRSDAAKSKLTHRLYCLDRTTGRPRWQIPVPGDVRMSVHPLAEGGIVALTNDRALVFSRLGEAVWKYEIKNRPAQQSVLAGNVLVYLDANRKLHALDLAAREEKWVKQAGRIHSPLMLNRGSVFYFSEQEKDYKEVLSGPRNSPLDLAARKNFYYTLECRSLDTGEVEWTAQNCFGKVEFLDNYVVVWGNLPELPLFGEPGAGYRSFVQCLGRADGKQIWIRAFPGKIRGAAFGPDAAYLSMPIAMESKILAAAGSEEGAGALLCAISFRHEYRRKLFIRLGEITSVE